MSRNLEILLEKRICRKAAAGLIRAGYTVGVNDGEETVLKRSVSLKEIMGAVFSTDEDYLYAYNSQENFPKAGSPAGARVGWVHIVWGNVEAVISDYTTNLEDALAPANAYADKF